MIQKHHLLVLIVLAFISFGTSVAEKTRSASSVVITTRSKLSNSVSLNAIYITECQTQDSEGGHLPANVHAHAMRSQAQDFSVQQKRRRAAADRISFPFDAATEAPESAQCVPYEYTTTKKRTFRDAMAADCFYHQQHRVFNNMECPISTLRRSQYSQAGPPSNIRTTLANISLNASLNICSVTLVFGGDRHASIRLLLSSEPPHDGSSNEPDEQLALLLSEDESFSVDLHNVAAVTETKTPALLHYHILTRKNSQLNFDANCQCQTYCGNHGYANSLATGNTSLCNCICDAGWSGASCNITTSTTPAPPTPAPLTPAQCTNANCNNHATSWSGTVGSCSCTCDPAWTDGTCSTSNVCTNAADCNGNAATVSGNRPSCTCTCDSAWTGTTCATSNVCTKAADCNSRATTVTGNRPNCACSCSPEWTDTACAASNVCTTAVDCNNRATTVTGNRPACTCYCLAAYHGKTCDVTYTLTPTAVSRTLQFTETSSIDRATISTTRTTSPQSSFTLSPPTNSQTPPWSFSHLSWLSMSVSSAMSKSTSISRSTTLSLLSPSAGPSSSPSGSQLTITQGSSLSQSLTVNISFTPSTTIDGTFSESRSKSLLLPPTASDTISLPNSSITSTHTTTNSPLPCHSLLMRASQVTVEFAPLTLPIPTSTNSSIASYTTLGYQNQSGTTSSGLSSAITPDSALPVGALSIDRRTLLYGWDNNGPPVLVANLTIQAPGQQATGLRIKNVTLNGNISLQHTYPYYGDSWHVVTLAPNPEYGWVAVSLWQPTTIVLDVHMICGAEDAVKVHITVPAPGFPQSFAAEVKAAVSSAQFIALAAGGGSSGAALGRLMATRSMVMCDADAAVGGGVLDLGLVPCSIEDNSNNIARSAVISNIVLVCIVALVLFLVGFVLALADPTRSVASAFRDSSSIVLLPSSLLTAFVSVLPSTAASATVLAARIGSSRCTGADAVLVVLSIILLATPITAVLLLYSHIGRHRWECRNDFRTHAKELEASGLLRKAQALFHQATRRRWKWQNALESRDQSPTMFQHMWVVLLEYRIIWYAAVDGCGLVAVGAFSDVGGLSSSSCHPFTGLVIALLCLQLLILNVSRPYTTLFEHVCSTATLGLTLLSVVGQLVFTLETPGPEWVLTMSAMCNLAIVGVSLVKSVLDASSLVLGLRRRILNARDVRNPAANRSPKLKSLEGTVSFSEHGHRCYSDHEEGPLRLNYEAVADSSRDLDGGSFSMHMMLPPLADVQLAAEIEDRFWDATGAAKVVHGSSSNSIIGEDTSTVIVDVGKEKGHTDRWRRSDAIVEYSLDGDGL